MTAARRTALIVSGLVAIALLLGLGAWQLYRLQWKLDLIAQLDQALAATPVPLGDLDARLARGDNVDWLKVTVTGHYRHDLERHVFALHNGGPGWRLVTPLVIPGDGVLLVDRGYVPANLEDPATRPESQVTPDPVTLTGYIRVYAGKPGPFAADSEPDRNRWYDFDPAALFASLPADQGLVAPGHKARYINLVLQVAHDGEPGRGRWPVSEPVNPALRNDHLQYALTWFSLAIALAVILGLMLRRPGPVNREP